jgi:hypothetical protein
MLKVNLKSIESLNKGTECSKAVKFEVTLVKLCLSFEI